MKELNCCGISDLHGNLIDNSKFGEGGDLLFIAGDIVPLDIQRDVLKSVVWFHNEFIPWVDSLPFKRVIMVFGNHDFFGEVISKNYNLNGRGLTGFFGLCCDNDSHKLRILLDNYIEYEGLKIYGTSWCPELNNWAFYKNSNGLKEKYSKMPPCDVLLTHCPPKGLCGTVLQADKHNHMTDYGSSELRDVLVELPCQYVICGHIHSGYHDISTIGAYQTNVINVSLLDENYTIAYTPYFFKIEPIYGPLD